MSKRPSSIKKIYTIDLGNNLSIYERRKHTKFNQYFDQIWKDLELDE